MKAVDDGIYEAKFDVADENTLFEVKLERGDDDESAESNSGELTIEWSPSGKSGEMAIAFDDEAGEGCIYSHDDDTVDDSGEYLLAPNVLDSTLDNESRFTLSHVRSVAFVSAP